MPYLKFDLPPYPLKTDMWDELKNEKRPIVVYGMGNGADKLILQFEKYGIQIADFFASDGFVRGHSFHGYRVKSFSEIKESYSEFVIVLSFASNRDEVVEMLSQMNSEYDMFVPDMPVAGEDEYFDKEFFNSRYEEIENAYSRLCDDDSKNAFAAIVNYKLTGRMDYLLSAYSTKDELYSLLPCASLENIVDVGAYNGDTVIEAKKYFPNLKRAVAIEPDKKNYRKLHKYYEAENEIDLLTINAAAWYENTEGHFNISGNRNSSIDSTASFEYKSEEVPFIKIDSLKDEKIDYIKYDVEGAEREALLGSHMAITKYHPTLLVSLYHRSRDIFSIINDLLEKYPFYTPRLRRLMCLPAWEIDLLLVDENKERKSNEET